MNFGMYLIGTYLMELFTYTESQPLYCAILVKNLTMHAFSAPVI